MRALSKLFTAAARVRTKIGSDADLLIAGGGGVWRGGGMGRGEEQSKWTAPKPDYNVLCLSSQNRSLVCVFI